MLNFYKIVKDNLNFNRFQYQDTVCLEYTCPLEAEHIGIFSQCDYVVHVLSGKKSYTTIHGEWTLNPGQTLYLKKGAEVVRQYFDDEYCMLGFFLSDELIRETFNELKGTTPLHILSSVPEFTGIEIPTTDFMSGYFHSMLNYFRGVDRPPDPLLIMKLKELLVTLMNGHSSLATYFSHMAAHDRPSLPEIMEQNFCYNLKIEDYAHLSHRSLSAFKREFQDHYHVSPGRWLNNRRIEHAAHLLCNTSQTVTSVAFESGFEDLSHFSRVFKKRFDLSPSDYKKSHVASS